MATAISGVLASAFSDILGTPVVTYDQYKQEEASGECDYQPLDIGHLFRLCYQSGGTAKEDDTPQTESSAVTRLSESAASLSLGPMDVNVKTVNNYTYTVRVDGDDTVKKLREKLREKIGMPCDRQRLLFRGRDLDDDRCISDCGITQGCTLEMLMTTRSATGENKNAKFFLDPSLLDPPFDYDFKDVKDGDTKFYRGGKRYHRPCGWMRYALKVKGEYEDDKWLGEPGHRLQSSDGEWPVSYHGTKKECSDSITRNGFLMSKGTRAVFGRGIYSTPSIEVAANPELYATPFHHEGKRYQLVFQNRISPQGMKVIPAHKTGARAEYWIQENDNLIRPYGICLRPAT